MTSIVEALPKEVLREILSHLTDEKDVVHAAKTCTQLKALADEPVIWNLLLQRRGIPPCEAPKARFIQYRDHIVVQTFADLRNTFFAFLNHLNTNTKAVCKCETLEGRSILRVGVLPQTTASLVSIRILFVGETPEATTFQNKSAFSSQGKKLQLRALCSWQVEKALSATFFNKVKEKMSGLVAVN